jgi:hypothetical protein
MIAAKEVAIKIVYATNNPMGISNPLVNYQILCELLFEDNYNYPEKNNNSEDHRTEQECLLQD